MSSSFTADKQRILKEAMTWFVQLQSDQCDSHQQKQFQSWLATSEIHRHAYQEAEKIWSNMDSLKQLSSTDIQATKKVKLNCSVTQITSLLLIFGLLGGSWLDYSTEVLTYSTAIGERRSINLADGSHLEMNAASHLTVKLSWFRRRVELTEGEALFTVAHQLFRPFSVYTHNLIVRDVGTVFNVRKLNEEIIISVIEGEVTLLDEHHLFAESLKAGFSRQLDNNGYLRTIEKSNSKKAISWVDGNLILEHTPLKKVTAELERYHAVHFVFADPDISKQTLSGTFATDNLNLFLKIIEKTLPLRITHKAETIILSKR